MPIINFTIPKNLEKRINNIVKEKGFASKAEFFRFAVISFMEKNNGFLISDDKKLEYLSDAISEEIVKKYKNKKIDSLKKQLSDL